MEKMLFRPKRIVRQYFQKTLEQTTSSDYWFGREYCSKRLLWFNPAKFAKAVTQIGKGK